MLRFRPVQVQEKRSEIRNRDCAQKHPRVHTANTHHCLLTVRWYDVAKASGNHGNKGPINRPQVAVAPGNESLQLIVTGHRYQRRRV